MGGLRKSFPISQPVTVSTHDANVIVQGVDCRAIGASFRVHLFVDDRRVASRFFLQASASPADRYADFDFTLPLETIANARLRVEIEPEGPGRPLGTDDASIPSLSVCLLLQSP